MRKNGSFYATAKSADGGPRIRNVVFCCLLGVGGLVALYFGWVRPMIDVWNARGWVPVPCDVISSHVDSQTRDNSTYYKAQVRFRYEYEGRQYQGYRYSFDESWSTRRAQMRIVDAYPAGTVARCHVNPLFPPEAVVEKDFEVSWFFFLFPMLFVGIGVVGTRWEFRR